MALARFAAALLIFLSLAGAAPAGARLALVIGNGDYRFSPLANPPRDAELTAAALRDAGFDVTLLIDADQVKMKQHIRAFAVRLRNAGPDAVGAFYYAGHGVQVEGRNYLIPVAATITAKPDLEYETIEAQWVLDMIGDSGARMSIIILDACRNNPFRSFTRSATRGLARMDAPLGALLSYSTAPGKVAADGDGRNSPFTIALARAIRTPGLKIEDAFKQVRREVLAATGNAQVPWESTSLTTDFYFMPPAGSGAAAQRPSAQPAADATPAQPAAQIMRDERTPSRFVPKELPMSDYTGDYSLYCYNPSTGDVQFHAALPYSHCGGGFYRISESDYFKILKNR